MIVWTNGNFDLLHLGHFNLLQYCKYLSRYTGKVVVGIDSDEKIKKDKGKKRPVFSQEERKRNLLSLIDKDGTPLVSEVYIFSSPEELHDLIEAVGPDVVVVGDDWKDKEVIGSDIADVNFFPRVENISTTEIIKRCKKC